MKTILLEGTWLIHAPIHHVYEIVTDFENAPKYFPLVAHSMKITTKNGNHMTIEAVSKTFGIPFHVLMETEVLPEKGFTSINTSSLAIEHEQFLLEDTPNGTNMKLS